MQKKVYGIVVTYYFKNEFKKNVNLFLNVLDFLYIIDNGSSNKHVNYLKELKNNKNNIHLQLNKFNFGLAKAQNLAAETTRNFELGLESDLTKVMINQQISSLGFQLTLNTRNKVLSAYKDIMSMPV